MAFAGWVLTGIADRLQRLARAQGEMVKALEVKLAQGERTASSLSATRSELAAIASNGSASGLAFLPAALRRLAETEAHLHRILMEVKEIRSRLLAAKVRQKAMARKARLLHDAMDRKRTEDDVLEASLIMRPKVSRKGDVVI